MDFCKIVNDEHYGQILAVCMEDEDTGAPMIRVMLPCKVDGIAFLSTEYVFNNTDEGRAGCAQLWEEEYLSGDDVILNIAWTLTKETEEMFEGI